MDSLISNSEDFMDKKSIENKYGYGCRNGETINIIFISWTKGSHSRFPSWQQAWRR